MADPLSIAASIVAILQLSAKVLAYLNDVKDASKDRAQCAVEASNLHSLLTNLRIRLEESTGSEPWYTAIRALTEKGRELDHFKAALLKLQNRMPKAGRWNTIRAALVWKFKRLETVEILDQMERLKSGIGIALQMDHFKLSESVNRNAEVTQSRIRIIQSNIDTVQLFQDSQKRRNILAWLSPSNYAVQLSDIINRRQEGTGGWFIASLIFETWLHQAGATLFCPGIPGAGETMIAATVIEHLRSGMSNSSEAVAYVFFNYKEHHDQNISDLLGAIIKQLVQSQTLIAGHILELYTRHGGMGKPTVDELTNALQAVVLELSTAYLVVDALDECSDDNGTRRQLSARLRLIQQCTGLHLMVTSRLLPDIVAEFPAATTLAIRANPDDVKQYVTGQLVRLPRCIQRDVSLQDQVRDEITKTIDGMFLLARLHVDSLLDKKTKKAVTSTLTRLPKSRSALKDAYGDAIERIDNPLNGDSVLAKRTLSWIALARRPLKVSELLCAFAVEPGVTELDPDNMLDIEDIVSVCAGLVNVEEESGSIRLVHYTTQDFLETILETWNPAAQIDVTTSCLSYLSFDDFRPAVTTSRKLQERLDDNKFLDYAGSYWGEHAKSVQADIYDEACAFLLDTPILHCAAQLLFREDARSTGISHFTTTYVHVVVRFGMCELLGRILRESKDSTAIAVNAQDHRFRTPILMAVDQGNKAMTEVLIEYGAELFIHEPPGNFKSQLPLYTETSLLHLASSRGHTEVVGLLLEKGVKIETVNQYGRTALYVATMLGQELVVELLIEKGAKVGTKSEPLLNYNLLQVAAEGGHVEVVTTLLRAGADVNPNTPDNPLMSAAERGRQQIVTMLLKAGADIDAHICGYTALGQTTFDGREQMVKLLLNAGADCNVGPEYWRPLEMAICRGRSSIIELLVAKGANTGDRTLEEILKRAANIRRTRHY